MIFARIRLEMKILQFEKIIEIPWIYNFINYHIFWMFEKLKKILKFQKFENKQIE